MRILPARMVRAVREGRPLPLPRQTGWPLGEWERLARLVEVG